MFMRSSFNPEIAQIVVHNDFSLLNKERDRDSVISNRGRVDFLEAPEIVK